MQLEMIRQCLSDYGWIQQDKTFTFMKGHFQPRGNPVIDFMEAEVWDDRALITVYTTLHFERDILDDEEFTAFFGMIWENAPDLDGVIDKENGQLSLKYEYVFVPGVTSISKAFHITHWTQYTVLIADMLCPILADVGDTLGYAEALEQIRIISDYGCRVGTA